MTAAAQSQRFPDVPADHYAFEAVEWAAAVGVTTGYGDGTFKPQRPLIKSHAVLFLERFYDEILRAEESEDFTRGDMMVLLKAINDGTINSTDTDSGAGSADTEATRRFPDVPADHYAFEAVEWAAAVGVTTGYGDGTFKPQRPLIKSHAVLFLERFYDEILRAEESEDFTRGDMMVLLKAINDGTLDTGAEQAPAFAAVSAGTWHTCGLRVGGTVDCWGSNSAGQAVAPQGDFIAVDAGELHTCGLRVGGTVECWGSNSNGQTRAPRGAFTAVSAGELHTCGLRVGGTVECWGSNSAGQTRAPGGTFAAVSAGWGYTCGLRVGGTVECWGSNSNGQTRAPGGTFAAVSADIYHTCGLRVGGTVECWGSNLEGETDVPEGAFTAVSQGWGFICGLRTGGTVECWGSRSAEGQTDAPSGAFAAVSAGLVHVCGLRTGGTVECWGDNSRRQSDGPRGYRLGASVCKPYGSDGTTAGFPLPRWAAPSVGTMRVAVLFVDFRDAEASHTTRQEAVSSLAHAEEFLERSSYGRLDVEFTPLHRWLRLRHNVGRYLEEGWLDWARTLDEAVQLAAPEFDFTGYDVVMVVHPSTHFSVVAGAFGAGPVTTDEAVVRSSTGINLARRPSSQDGVDPWGRDAAHELGHALGLADLYLYGNVELPEAPRGKVWVRRRYDLMGLAVHHLANEWNPRFRATWRSASGATWTTFETAAYEMLAWSRWQLGWLDDSQVRCINLAETTVSLSPVASPGDGTAMVAVPLSDTEMIVIESRRNLGYDTAHRVTRNGATQIRPAPLEGVLVYTVDASLPSGRLPIKVAGDTGDQRIERDPILTAGQSITVHGYTITVKSDDGDTHIVEITKTSD